MSNAEFEKLKEALRKPATPEAMREAAKAFERYQAVSLAQGRRSKPTLVSLGLRKAYPHAIPLDKVPQELERNPEFFELMRKIVAREKG